MGVTGHVAQINLNPRGGVPKHAVASAEVTVNGVVGDRQRDLRVHGGPQRAVSLYATERIEALRAEGHPIGPGTTGENLTVSGLDWSQLRVGDRLLVGEWVELEITGFVTPCSNIEQSFAGGAFKRISEKLHPGWSRLYAKVLGEGVAHVGDRVEHLPG
ncbi:MAG: MOSC domain-containing protein [Chloroflexales bacterium]|nr:MOSC domain-containing protein [Chloroflexales bacterium]